MPETRKMQRPVSPTATRDAEPWHTRAACTPEDAPLFDYDPRMKQHDEGVVEAAREICRSCPVLDACILDTLDFEAGKPWIERFEIVGALTPKQRAGLDPTARKVGDPRYCRNGHPRTPENQRNNGSGATTCAVCRHEQDVENGRARRARAKELTA